MRVIEFSQKGCHACQELEKLLPAIEARCGVTFERRDAGTTDKALATSFGVTGTPTVVVLDDSGKKVASIVGYKSVDEMASLLSAAGACKAPSTPSSGGGSLPVPIIPPIRILNPLNPITPAPVVSPDPVSTPTTPTSPPAPTPEVPKMARVIEIVQPGCHSCEQAAPVVAAINAQCGGVIQQVNGAAYPGTTLAGKYGITSTPTFLFLSDDLQREVGSRIATVPTVEQLRAAIEAVIPGRCSGTAASPSAPPYTPPPSPPPSTPSTPSTPSGGIPGGGYGPSAPAGGGDIAQLPADQKVRVIATLSFETDRSKIYALASSLAASGFSRAAGRLRAVADRMV